MAKTEEETKKKNKKEEKNQNKDGNKKKQDQKQGEGDKKGGKKGGKKKKKEYKPGMPSYAYDPCPHRVWTPKPGERDKSEPRGVGSPWYEPVRKKEDIEKEEEEKNKKKEEKAAQKRQKAYEERQKKKEEEEKKQKEEEKKKEEKQKEKEKKKKQKEKEKKKKEDEKRKKQKEEREKKKKEEEEKKKKEEEEKKKEEEEKKKGGGKEDKDKKKKGDKEDKDKKKEKEKKEEPLPASYMYEPCPHKVYTPAPGAKDMADPRGVGSPWYVPVRKKEDIEKEEAEKQEEENAKIKEKNKQRRKEQRKKEKEEEEERKKEEEKQRRREKVLQEREEEKRKEREERKQEKEREEQEKYMGAGVSKSRTDFTPELKLLFDFMIGVDEKERERRGEALQWRKEEIEAEMESHLAKDAFTRDFKTLISTFVEAEYKKADKIIKKLKREERRRRREIFENMDPLAKDMMAEGTRFNILYKAAMGEKENKRDIGGEGEPSVMEDLVVSMIMQQMDTLLIPPEPTSLFPTPRSMLTVNH